MLRRPSVSPVLEREEGCSSTAFAGSGSPVTTAWNNLVGRGSVITGDPDPAAVP